MGGRCTFFESETWDERLEAYVGRVWDLETTLRKVGDSDPQHRIEEIATMLDADPASIAVTSIGDVLAMDEADILNVSLSGAATVWRDDQPWLPQECPHEPIEGTDRCVFHLPPTRYDEAGVTHSETSEQLLHALDPDSGQQTCFVGAHLKILDLSGVHIARTDSTPIDFRLATIDSTVDCSDAVFGLPLTMVGADLCRDGQSEETTTGTAANRYISVNGDIDFSGVAFRASADFKHARFRAAATFNGATFDDVAMFNYAHFADQVELWATVSGKADFSKATLRGGAQLRGTFETAVIFNYTTFKGDVVLWNSTIDGKAEFLATEFEGAVDCGHVAFKGLTRFCETTFRDTVNLQNAQFTDTVRLRRVRAPNAVIDLQNAELAAGRLELGDEAHFDLAGATLGRVSIDVTEGVSLPADPIAYLRIQRTNFNGFDFSAHAGSFKPDWRLDALAPSWPVSYRESDEDALAQYEMLEDTYLRAKSGATEAGHNKAASEFFVHEMRYRRKQHATLARRRVRQSLRNGPSSVPQYATAPVVGLGRSMADLTRALVPGIDRGATKRADTPGWLAGYRWLSNGTLGLIAGYGERPQRPIMASLTTIGVFAVAYRLLEVTPPSDAPVGLGYLLLSLQSFITFILGSSPVSAGFGPQLLSAIEGFLGAFLIAVFVFSLTRSIHR